MHETIDQHLKDSFYKNPDIEALVEQYEKNILEDKISSFRAAKLLLEKYSSGQKG